MTSTTDHGVALTAAIVAHPATPGIIDAIKARIVLGPLDEVLADQIAVLQLSARLASIRVVDQDLTAQPNPFDPAAGWWPDSDERIRAALAAAGLGQTIRRAAGELAAADVPVDPEAPMDLVVVAELLLLAVDWSQSARDLAEDLQPPAPWGVSSDGRTLVVRADLRGQAERDAVAFRRRVETAARVASGRVELRAPYAKGHRRMSPEVARRRAALSVVLDHFPDAEAHNFGSVAGRPTPIAALFADELVRRGGRPWLLAELRSRRRLLADELRALRKEGS